MKIIVTHTSPDWDAITSVWLLRRFLPNWSDAKVVFVPAGTRMEGAMLQSPSGEGNPIENVAGDDVIHVDTGLGPLDHHQTNAGDVCGASLTWDFVRNFQEQSRMENKIEESEKWEVKKEALSRMVAVVVDIDHFRELFWENQTADYHEFSLVNVLDGMKLAKPDQDDVYMTFGIECLDSLVHGFENRIWAEREIAKKGIAFETRFGKAMGFETLNDTVLKLAQKMGYVLVVRKDPRKGYVRIKARPPMPNASEKNEIDLTPAYDKLKEMDPDATWFLHVSKRMLLNGTTKNPKMRPSSLSLHDIIEVLKSV